MPRPPVAGATLKARSDTEAIAAADRIVRGRVEAVRTERRSGSGVIETIARVRVIDDYTGGADRVIEIRELGGTFGRTTLHVPGAARFIVGDDIVALVERKGGGWRPSAMGRSVYGVRDTLAGAELIRQDTGEPIAGAVGPGRRSLSSFAESVRAVRGRGATRLSAPGGDLAAASNLAVATPTIEAYRLLGNMRWHEADAGQTVLWYRNTLTAPPLDSGNSETEISRAMSAWTNPAGASISLAYGGTRLVPTTSILSCGAPPVLGGGLITYEDPDDDITTSGVIAIGGACSSGVTAIVNGTTFSRITYGFVIFTTKADMPSLGQSLFLARVTEHEVGHAIGLGHTQTDGTVAGASSNIMYPSCCQSNTPVPPAIGPDDLAGLDVRIPGQLGWRRDLHVRRDADDPDDDGRRRNRIALHRQHRQRLHVVSRGATDVADAERTDDPHRLGHRLAHRGRQCEPGAHRRAEHRGPRRGGAAGCGAGDATR